MNIDHDTIRIMIRFENGSDDPDHYTYYDECGFAPGLLTPDDVHRLLQIHLHSDTVQCTDRNPIARYFDASTWSYRRSHVSAH